MAIRNLLSRRAWSLLTPPVLVMLLAVQLSPIVVFSKELATMTKPTPSITSTLEELKNELKEYLPTGTTAVQLSAKLMPSNEEMTWLMPQMVYEREGKYYSPSGYRETTNIHTLLAALFASERLADRDPIFVHVFVRNGVLTHEFEYVEDVGTEQTLYMRATKAEQRFFGKIVDIEVPKPEINPNNTDAPQMGVEDED
jgi:hypothetical protein